MNEIQLIDLLKVKSEKECIEFKEAKSQFSVLGNNERNRNSILGLAVAMGNEGGGKLLLGVKNAINPKTEYRDIVGTSALENIEQVKSQIFTHLKIRIGIDEIK